MCARGSNNAWIKLLRRHSVTKSTKETYEKSFASCSGLYMKYLLNREVAIGYWKMGCQLIHNYFDRGYFVRSYKESERI